MPLTILQDELLNSINSSSNRFSEYIKGSKSLSQQARINIYRSSTRETLVKTLQSIYPICQAILGEKYFTQLCHQYAQKNLSQHWDLNRYGDNFPTFLNGHTEGFHENNRLPYLKDLAKLEWLLHAVYYTADNIRFPYQPFNHLSTEEQANCQFILADNVQIMSSTWPIHTLWQRWQQGSLPREVAGLDNGHQYLCIYRDQYRPTATLIDPALFRLLTLINKYTLADLAQLAERDRELQSALPRISECMEKGWINDFLPPEVDLV